MAFRHGKDTVFKLDTVASGNALTDISSYTDTSDLARTIETGETTTFGADNKTYVIGLADATISLGGKWDEDLDEVMVGGNQIIRDFQYNPEGETSGRVEYTGDCILTNYTISNPLEDVVMWSADMQITGAVSRGTA